MLVVTLVIPYLLLSNTYKHSDCLINKTTSKLPIQLQNRSFNNELLAFHIQNSLAVSE